MSSKYVGALLLVLAGLPACQSPGPGPVMVGGPCRYEDTTVTATVTRIFDDGIEFSEDGAATFEVRPQDFAEPPEPGQRYEFAKRYIVEGACTPYSYHVIRRVGD